MCGYLCLENWNRELMSRAIKRRLYTISSIWRDCESESESESSCTTLAASSLRLRCSMRVRSAMRAIRSRSVRLRLRACSSSLRCCICSSDLPAWNARAMYTGIPGYLLRMYSTPLPARLSSGVMTGYPKRCCCCCHRQSHRSPVVVGVVVVLDLDSHVWTVQMRYC